MTTLVQSIKDMLDRMKSAMHNTALTHDLKYLLVRCMNAIEYNEHEMRGLRRTVAEAVKLRDEAIIANNQQRHRADTLRRDLDVTRDKNASLERKLELACDDVKRLQEDTMDGGVTIASAKTWREAYNKARNELDKLKAFGDEQKRYVLLAVSQGGVTSVWTNKGWREFPSNKDAPWDMTIPAMTDTQALILKDTAQTHNINGANQLHIVGLERIIL